MPTKKPGESSGFFTSRIYPSAPSPGPTGTRQAVRVLTNTREPTSRVEHASIHSTTVRRACGPPCPSIHRHQRPVRLDRQGAASARDSLPGDQQGQRRLSRRRALHRQGPGHVLHLESRDQSRPGSGSARRRQENQHRRVVANSVKRISNQVRQRRRQAWLELLISFIWRKT